MTRSTRVSVRIAAPLVLILAACGDDAEQGLDACGREACPPTCTEPSDPCDILEGACRQQVLAAVVCVRGTPGEAPDVRVIDAGTNRQELEAAYLGDAGQRDVDAAVLADAGSNGGADDDRDAPLHWTRALQLLGLLEPDTTTLDAFVEERATQTGGYYDRGTRTITLIDLGQPLDSISARRSLAHEFVHALQDQQVGLSEIGERAGGSNDGSTALRCLTEGDATHYARLASDLLRGVSVDPAYDAYWLESSLKYTRDEVARDPNPYYAVSRLVYPVGSQFVLDAWQQDGNVGVQRLLAAPPLSTVQWMMGYGAFQEALEPPVQPLACNGARPPTPDHEVYLDASFGALVVYAVLARTLVQDGVYANEEAWRLALSWRQDRLTVFSDDTAATALSFRVRFDSDQRADEVADAFRRRIDEGWPNVKLRAEGPELELLASDDAALLSDWQGTDPCDCPVDE